MTRIAWVLAFVAVAAGCGSSVSKETSGTKLERTFPKSYASVEAAAKQALVTHGFEVTGEEEGFLTGHRPNQVGFFVGSGGENVGVWLTKVGDEETKVAVATKLTVLGVAGQENWDDEVMGTIAEKLR